MNDAPVYALLVVGALLIVLASPVGSWIERSRVLGQESADGWAITRRIRLSALALFAGAILWQLWSVAIREWTGL